jgi:hypothetical protein
MGGCLSGETAPSVPSVVLRRMSLLRHTVTVSPHGPGDYLPGSFSGKGVARKGAEEEELRQSAVVAPARTGAVSRRSDKYDLELLKLKMQEPLLPGEDVLKLTAAAAPMALSSVRELRRTRVSAAPGTAAAAAAAAAAEDRERRAEAIRQDRPLDVLHDIDMFELLAFNQTVLHEFANDLSMFDEYLRALAENATSKVAMRARLAVLFDKHPQLLDGFDELTACDGTKEEQRCSLVVVRQAAAQQAPVTPDITSCIKQMEKDLNKCGPERTMLLELLATYEDGLVTQDECVMLVSKLLHDSGRSTLLRKFTTAVGGAATKAAAATAAAAAAKASAAKTTPAAAVAA